MSASLLSTETLRVLNLGASGALVEAGVPLPLNAEYQMQIVLHSHVSEVTVKVRRVDVLAEESGPIRYQLGLEFLSISAEAEEIINEMVVSSQSQASGGSR
jgi:c-di-GMP-binding flagellar brake protein YcgR